MSESQHKIVSLDQVYIIIGYRTRSIRYECYLEPIRTKRVQTLLTASFLGFIRIAFLLGRCVRYGPESSARFALHL